MAEKNTAQVYVQYFADRLRRVQEKQRQGDASVGKEPVYPMLVVFLGEKSMNGYPVIAANLLGLWPQYYANLKYIGITEQQGQISYTRLEEQDHEVKKSAISGADVAGLIASLYGTQAMFQDKSNFLVYYVLETTDFERPEDYKKWLNIIREFKQSMMISPLDMLTVLLNEDFLHQRMAAAIRNLLAEYYQIPYAEKPCSILLLSNRRDDSVILEDWRMCYNITAAVIALSNNDDPTVDLHQHMIMTASYAREEKPVEDIARVAVTELLDELQAMGLNTESKNFVNSELKEKLGFQPDGTLKPLNDYAEQNLFPMLPDAEMLEFFPRRDYYESSALETMSARAFSEYTMGAWDAYLAGLVADAKRKVEVDSVMRKRWADDYSELLRSEFTLSQIAEMDEHMTEVKKAFCKADKPSEENPVLVSAKAQLRCLLSNDAKLADVFLGVIRKQGEDARVFQKAWSFLMQSRRNLPVVHEQNVRDYYQKRVRNYMDHNGNEIRRRYDRLQNVEGMDEFLRSLVEDVISQDPLYSDTFEDELNMRMRQGADQKDAERYIIGKLTGASLRLYFMSPFQLRAPFLSAIMLKFGTKLETNLRNNMEPGTYYYNTGSGNSAEAINIFHVSEDMLVN